MKRGIIATIFLLFCFYSSFSTSSLDVEWNEGVLVLFDNTVIKGDVHYNHKHSLVLVKSESKIATYSTQLVKNVRYYDKEENINRYFVHLGNDVEVRASLENKLFEVVIYGAVKLYRVPKKITNYYYSDAGNDFNEQHNYIYFFITLNQLHELSDFKKYLLPLLFNQNTTLAKQSIKSNKLNLNNPGHCIQLIVLSNQAVNETSCVELTSL